MKNAKWIWKTIFYNGDKMNILGFDFFIILGHLKMVSPSLRKKIKEDLRTNGKYHTSPMLTKKCKCLNISSELIEKIIKKYEFVDKSYYNMIDMYDEYCVKNLLMVKGWNHSQIDRYISKLYVYFEKLEEAK